MTGLGTLPWTDLVCVLVLAAYGIGGLRSGFIATGFSLAGFLAGGVLALIVVPQVRDLLPASQARPWLQPLIVILISLLMALLGQLIGGVIGRRLTRDLDAGPVYWVNAVGGLAVAIATTAVALWLVAGAVRATSAGSLSTAVASSRILTTIDSHMPGVVSQAAADLRGRVVAAGLPQVFAGLSPEPIVPAQAPDGSAVSSATIEGIRASVVRIDGLAPQCGSTLEGTGWVYSSGRIVTNAHVVAGTDEVYVTSGGERWAGEVVLFDADTDVAVIAVDGLPLPTVPLGDPVSAGDDAAALGYPLAGDFRVEPVRVRALVEARGQDIYGKDPVVRSVYSLRGVVQPGNSGGPLIDESGRAVGLIFARSLDDPETGYALALEEISPDLIAGQQATGVVDTGACVRL